MMDAINFLLDQVQHVLFWTGDFCEYGLIELIQALLKKLGSN